MIYACKQCGAPFTVNSNAMKFCNPVCSRRYRTQWEMRKVQRERDHARAVSAPGVRVMTQPWSQYRYAAGTTVGKVKCEDQRDFVRVRLDMGVTFDFPAEHIDILEGGGNHALNDRASSRSLSAV